MKSLVAITLCVFWLLAMGCGKFGWDPASLSTDETTQLRFEATHLVKVFEESTTNYWRGNGIPETCTLIRSWHPMSVFVKQLPEVGHVVDVRVTGGFRHHGLLVVVGADSKLDAYEATSGISVGWKNRKIANRVFEYKE